MEGLNNGKLKELKEMLKIPAVKWSEVYIYFSNFSSFLFKLATLCVQT